jgi:PAS domain-containing protein
MVQSLRRRSVSNPALTGFWIVSKAIQLRAAVGNFMWSARHRIRGTHLIILATAVALYCLFHWLDGVDHLHELTRSNKEWVDEWLISLVVVTFALIGLLFVRNDNLKREVQRRAESERRLDAALGNMRQGLVMYGADQRMLVCNERYAKMYKFPTALGAAGNALAQYS